MRRAFPSQSGLRELLGGSEPFYRLRTVKSDMRSAVRFESRKIIQAEQQRLLPSQIICFRMPLLLLLLLDKAFSWV